MAEWQPGCRQVLPPHPNGRYPSPGTCLNHALALDRSHLARGNAYFRLRLHQQAEEDFTRAIALEPGCIDAYEQRGRLPLSSGQYAHAIEDLTTALRLAPSGVQCLLDRASARCSSGALAAAIEDLDALLAYEPDHAQAYDMRGLTFEGLGDVQAAYKDYTRALAADPENSWSGAAFRARGQARRLRQRADS